MSIENKIIQLLFNPHVSKSPETDMYDKVVDFTKQTYREKIPSKPKLMSINQINFLSSMVLSEIFEFNQTLHDSYDESKNMIRSLIQSVCKDPFQSGENFTPGIFSLDEASSLYVEIIKSIYFLFCDYYEYDVNYLFTSTGNIASYKRGFIFGQIVKCMDRDVKKVFVRPSTKEEILAEQTDAIVDILYYVMNACAKNGFILFDEIHDKESNSYNQNRILNEMLIDILRISKIKKIPVEKVFNAVHESNMAKRDPETGKFIIRGDGKVMKPEGWKAPNVYEIIWNTPSNEEVFENLVSEKTKLLFVRRLFFDRFFELGKKNKYISMIISINEDLLSKLKLCYDSSSFKDKIIEITTLLNETEKCRNQIKEIDREADIIKSNIIENIQKVNEIEAKIVSNVHNIQLTKDNQEAYFKEDELSKLRVEIQKLTLLNQDKDTKIQNLTEDVKRISEDLKRLENREIKENRENREKREQEQREQEKREKEREKLKSLTGQRVKIEKIPELIDVEKIKQLTSNDIYHTRELCQEPYDKILKLDTDELFRFIKTYKKSDIELDQIEQRVKHFPELSQLSQLPHLPELSQLSQLSELSQLPHLPQLSQLNEDELAMLSKLTTNDPQGIFSKFISIIIDLNRESKDLERDPDIVGIPISSNELTHDDLSSHSNDSDDLSSHSNDLNNREKSRIEFMNRLDGYPSVSVEDVNNDESD